MTAVAFHAVAEGGRVRSGLKQLLGERLYYMYQNKFWMDRVIKSKSKTIEELGKNMEEYLISQNGKGLPP